MARRLLTFCAARVKIAATYERVCETREFIATDSLNAADRLLA
jgi:hypothetical protein